MERSDGDDNDDDEEEDDDDTYFDVGYNTTILILTTVGAQTVLSKHFKYIFFIFIKAVQNQELLPIILQMRK